MDLNKFTTVLSAQVRIDKALLQYTDKQTMIQHARENLARELANQLLKTDFVEVNVTDTHMYVHSDMFFVSREKVAQYLLAMGVKED